MANNAFLFFLSRTWSIMILVDHGLTNETHQQNSPNIYISVESNMKPWFCDVLA